MASYLVAGASRGLGFEYLRQLSANPDNVVVGLVRNVEATKEKVAAEINRPNIHLFYADLDDYKTLPAAVEATSAVTDGKLDYLIGNAGVGGDHFPKTITQLAKEPEEMEKDMIGLFRTNAIAYAHLVPAFLPLIQAGKTKKITIMSTGMADVDLVRQHNAWMGVSYAVTKAALDMIIAKLSAELSEQGILVMGISPGFIITNEVPNPPEDVLKAFMAMTSKFKEYEPSFEGPISAEESIKACLSVIENASLEKGNGGGVVSHLGNRRWL